MATRRDYTIKELAELAGLSVRTIRARISEGTLPAYRLGYRTVRIRRADGDAFLDGRRIPTMGTAVFPHRRWR